MKFIETQGALINLENVTSIQRFEPTKSFRRYGITFRFSEASDSYFNIEYERKRERDLEWQRIAKNACSEEGGDE